MTTAEPGHCPVPRSSRNASTDLDRISGASSSRSSSRLTGGTLEENVAIRSRSEEHTSELQSPCNLVCRLLLEKKKKQELEYNMTVMPSHDHLHYTSERF